MPRTFSFEEAAAPRTFSFEEAASAPSLSASGGIASRARDIVAGAANFLDWPARGAAAVPFAIAEAIKKPEYNLARDFPESLSTFTESGHIPYTGPKDIPIDVPYISPMDMHRGALDQPRKYEGDKIPIGQVPEEVVGRIFQALGAGVHKGANAVFEGALPGELGKGSPALATGLEILGNAIPMLAPMMRGGKPIERVASAVEIPPADQMRAVRPENAIVKEIQNAIDQGQQQAGDRLQYPRNPSVIPAEGLNRDIPPALDAGRSEASGGNLVQPGAPGQVDPLAAFVDQLQAAQTARDLAAPQKPQEPLAVLGVPSKESLAPAEPLLMTPTGTPEGLAALKETQARTLAEKGQPERIVETPATDEGAARILRNMAAESGWAEIGGRIIRSGEGASAEEIAMGRGGESGDVVGRTTWVPHAEWFGVMRRELTNKGLADERQIDKAVEMHLNGEKLNANQKRTVDWMLGQIKEERQAEVSAGIPEGEGVAIAMALKGDNHEITAQNMGDVDRVARAAEINPDAVERLAIQSGNDIEAFTRGIDGILSEKTQSAAVAEGSQKGQPFALKGETEAQARAREQAGSLEAVRKAQAVSAPPPEDFTLAGSNSPADQARARGQMELAPVVEARPLQSTPTKELQQLARSTEDPAQLKAAEDELNLRSEEKAKATEERLANGREAKAAEKPVPVAVPKRFETPGLKEAADAAEAALRELQAQPKAYGSGTLGMNAMLDPKLLKETVKDIANSPIVNVGREAVQGFAEDLQMKTSPMSAGTQRSRAIAKDYANAERLARYQWAQFDEILKKNYSSVQRKKMWNAADEENLLREKNVPEAERKGKGIDSLTPDERATMGTLHQYGEALLERARVAGLFTGEGVKYWAPRVVAMIGEDGTFSAPKGDFVGSSGTVGRNITTSAPSLKARKYLTSEETEAAAKTKFGEGATVLRDIRTMPMAMARLERAIAGRELINGIKEVGARTGQELVADGAKEGYFTIDHPAFKTYRPRFVDEGGKQKPAVDQNGDTVFDRVPIYVSKEFEGPLKAVMSEQSGKLYEAMMAVKSKTMGLIMYSPLIHNAVEWGRALPMMPGKILTFKVYFEGNAAKNDPVQIRDAISNGMVPIGKRFQNQDISGLMEEPNIAPGRSLTAKAIGGAAGLVNKTAGEAVKRGIDVAGDFWHNTLLWDRIGDLQMGLYANIKRDLVGKGTDEGTAGKIAAHFANRYAGALPNEAMSAAVRKAANFVLFSRTFTLGNLGVMKDILTGLPRDVRAQIARDSGTVAEFAAKGIGQRKAIQAFATDIALMYVGASSLQSAFDVLKNDKTLEEVARGYADRWDRLVNRVRESPTDLANPFLTLDHLSSTSENEPGKERRILTGYDDKGTGIYMRMPTGKIGEEFVDWTTSPLDILKRKEGTLMRPLVQTLTNDKGFGRRVYNPDEPGFKGAAKAAGNVLGNIISQQFPVDVLASAIDIAKGKSEEMDAYKAIGPLFGLTFSKGAPGGPEVGQMFAVERKHRAEIADAIPEIKKLIKHGDINEAVARMEEVNMTAAEIRATLKFSEAPSARLTPSRVKGFAAKATEAEVAKFERMRESRP